MDTEEEEEDDEEEEEAEAQGLGDQETSLQDVYAGLLWAILYHWLLYSAVSNPCLQSRHFCETFITTPRCYPCTTAALLGPDLQVCLTIALHLPCVIIMLTTCPAAVADFLLLSDVCLYWWLKL